MLAAIAAVTTRLKVGSAVYHILGEPPATLALQAVGLDELSSGRFFWVSGHLIRPSQSGMGKPSITHWAESRNT